MHIFDITTGKKIHDFSLDMGTVSEITGKRYHTEMFYSVTSFLTPTVISRVQFDGGKITEEVFVLYCFVCKLYYTVAVIFLYTTVF